MALSDYRLCDVCEQKAFYDARLNYEFQENSGVEYPDGRFGYYRLDYLGAWAVLCDDCVKTHRVMVVAREFPVVPTTADRLAEKKEDA